jgi:hypothetical protein
MNVQMGVRIPRREPALNLFSDRLTVSQGSLKPRMGWVRLPLREPRSGDRTAASTAVFQTAHASSSLAHRSSFERKGCLTRRPISSTGRLCFVITRLAFEGSMGFREGHKEDGNEFDAKAGSTTECVL